MCERCSQTGMLSGELAHSNTINKVICFFFHHNFGHKIVPRRGYEHGDRATTKKEKKYATIFHPHFWPQKPPAQNDLFCSQSG